MAECDEQVTSMTTPGPDDSPPWEEEGRNYDPHRGEEKGEAREAGRGPSSEWSLGPQANPGGLVPSPEL